MNIRTKRKAVCPFCKNKIDHISLFENGGYMEASIPTNGRIRYSANDETATVDDNREYQCPKCHTNYGRWEEDVIELFDNRQKR